MHLFEFEICVTNVYFVYNRIFLMNKTDEFGWHEFNGTECFPFGS